MFITYKWIHDSGPEYLRDHLIPYTATQSLCSAADSLLTILKSRLQGYGNRAFEVVAPKL